MVKAGRINLVEEFQNQKNNDYVILTTYTFDPLFFDNFILKELVYNNPNSEIIVLVDAEQYDQIYNNFTAVTGVKYHLIPIYTTKGVFHPKIFLFVSESQITYYLGSGNLTLQGFTKNAELISKTQYKIDNCYSDIEDIVNILKGLSNEYIHGKKVKKIINNEITTYFPKEYSNNNNFKIIHNLKEPILNQILKELDTFTFDEITTLAPFLSESPLVIKRFSENLDFKKINILLPKNNHNLQYPEVYQNFANQNSIKLTFKDASFKENGRKFHSKIIWFNGKTNYLLIGSPNLTISALLKSAEEGNIEFSVLYKDIDPQEIFNEIKVKEIKDLTKIKPVNSDNYRTHTNPIKIFSADFDDISRKLQVKTEKIDDEAKILVSIANSKEIEQISNLKDGKINIKIPKSYPTEIKIICQEREARRRIFYDANSIFKKIRKIGGIHPKDLDTKLYNEPNIDITDILSIIDGISRPETTDSTNGQQPKKNENVSNTKKSASPSSVSRKNANTLIRDLNRIHKFMIHRNRIKNDEDNLHEKEFKTPSSTIRYTLNDKEIQKTLIRIIKLGNEIIINYTTKKGKETEETKLIRSQSILINLFLPFCISFLEDDIDKANINRSIISEAFELILTDNLKDINKNNCSKESLIMFFSRLLTLSYLFKNKDYYGFTSNIFLYSDLIDKNNYHNIKEYVIKSLESSNLTYNHDEFAEYYSILLDNTLDSSTFSKGLKNILDIISEENDEFKNILLKTTSMICGFDDYYGRFSINEELLNEARTYLSENN